MQKYFTIVALVGALLAGCAPQYVGFSPADPQDVPARRAVFDANPSGLDEAFAKGCQSPGDKVSQPSRDTVRCNIVPTPESAAFLLLEFDAELAPPTIIVQKVTRTLAECVLVELSYFAEITAKSGSPRRVYVVNRSLDRRLDEILRASGGAVKQPAPDGAKPGCNV